MTAIKYALQTYFETGGITVSVTKTLIQQAPDYDSSTTTAVPTAVAPTTAAPTTSGNGDGLGTLKKIYFQFDVKNININHPKYFLKIAIFEEHVRNTSKKKDCDVPGSLP